MSPVLVPAENQAAAQPPRISEIPTTELAARRRPSARLTARTYRTGITSAMSRPVLWPADAAAGPPVTPPAPLVPPLADRFSPAAIGSSAAISLYVGHQPTGAHGRWPAPTREGQAHSSRWSGLDRPGRLSQSTRRRSPQATQPVHPPPVSLTSRQRPRAAGAGC